MPGECRVPRRYVAIVAEKPKAGEKIARALGPARKCRDSGVPFWIVAHNGSTLVVVPSAGHLMGPSTKSTGFPVFDYEWRPIWEFDRGGAHTRKFYRLLSRILPGASLYVNACDYDIEGSVIGYMIIREFGDLRRARRMRFSTLAPQELRRAYRNLEPLDTDMVEAGIARHEMDWVWGINVSRALMEAYRRIAGRKMSLSSGRVQGPTLAEAVRRWEEINLHVPLPSFSLSIDLVTARGEAFTATPDGWRPETRSEARRVKEELLRDGWLRVVDYRGERREVRPPPAFNLGDLQMEASRIYGFSPMKTQSIAEDLYLDALISYPRTNSQKLPPAINYAAIISSLKGSPYHGRLAEELEREAGGVFRPVQGRKDDPAHPAIHPTGEKPGRLDRDHYLVYDLIVRRFLAAFAMPAVVSRSTVVLKDSSGRRYSASGIEVQRRGWYKYYHFEEPRERKLPRLSPGERVRVRRVSVSIEWSKCSERLSKDSLLKWMERVGIGTESTRARIIETLYRRGYLDQRGRKTVVTDLGYFISQTIRELFPDLHSPDLTREFERVLEDIRMGRATRREALEKTKETLSRLLREYSDRLEKVSSDMALALRMKRAEKQCEVCGRQVAEESLGLCQVHGKALKRLSEALPEISRRLESSLEDSLRTVSARNETGSWVRELAEKALRAPRLKRRITGHAY